MTKIKSYTIHLLNKPYTVKCPEHEADHLKQAAIKLNEHMQACKKQFKHLDEFQSLLLAALNISNECLTEKNQQDERQSQLTQLIHSLESKITDTTTQP